MRRHIIRLHILLAILPAVVAAVPASAQNVSLPPDGCVGGSVLPATYQGWQTDGRWMGLAVAPDNPQESVFLEILTGENPAFPVSYAPVVASERPNATNFAVRNFAGQPDAYVLGRASTTPAMNRAHVAAWSTGEGFLVPGPAGQTRTYGGTAGACSLLRVFAVYLEAGRDYDFFLSRDNGDDVKMALLQTGARPDGWVLRDDALWEKSADPTGSAVAQAYSPSTTGNYALAVFVDDADASGGEYLVRFAENVPSPAAADLHVTAIAPTTVTASTPFSATVTVANRGGAGSGPTTTRLSLDGVEMCGAIPTPAIPAGGSVQVACSLPGLAAGSHALLAEADSGDTEAEGDETNNSLARTLSVSSGPQPDLVVDLVLPRGVVPGVDTSLYVTVSNIGGAAAAATVTRCSVDGGAVVLDIPTPALASGQQTTVNGVLPGLAAGDHDFVATADHGGTETESNESNNSYAFTLAAEGPDLVIDGFTPTEFRDDQPVVFDVTVRNAGNGTAGESYTRVTVTGAGYSNRLTPALAAGASTVVQVTLAYLPDPGAHDIEVCADATGLVTESDETNNCTPGSMLLRPVDLLWPHPLALFPTLQEAIDIVAPGGRIRVLGGTYSGDGNRDLVFRGKDLTLTRYNDTPVVIDCGGDPDNPHRGFRFSSGETAAAVVEGLTIVNGWQESGAGGGILVGNADPTIRDCVIRNCWADAGGAIAFSSTAPTHPAIEGCTLVNNGANLGGAVLVARDSGPVFSNTIIANNFSTTEAVVCDGTLGTPVIVFLCSNIWNNGGGDWTGCIAAQLGSDDNFSQDPFFCDPASDDYHLAANSPCAETMNASCGRIGALPAACGVMGGTVRSVRADGTGPYATIQHAINNAVEGDVVELEDGIYSGTGNWDVSTLGKAIVVRSQSGDPWACRINGQNAHRGFALQAGETRATVISGIGITGGAAATGGGILCDGASPTLDNVMILDCAATGDGGGLHLVNGASPLITDCVFELNSSGDDGGALYAATNSSPEIRGTGFLNNSATNRGGGACFAVNCFPTIDDCRFLGNIGPDGGALAFVYAYGPVTNTVFHGNSATNGGAYFGHGNARCAFTACTFAENDAPNGAHVWLQNNSDPTFDRCLLAFGFSGAAVARGAADCTATFTCSDIHGNALGDWTAMLDGQFGSNGNINADPLFCDLWGVDLSLRGDSPCALANNVGCGQIGALAVGCSGSWLVRPDGSGDFATIQDAIEAAVPGETVVLADGVFTGPGNRDLAFGGKAITVRSQSGDASACIIDCNGTSAAPHFGFDFVAGETGTSVLENVTVRGGWRGTGAGIRITAAGPTLRGVVLEGNEAGDSGGGMIMGSGATPVLEDCVFRNNLAANAGGGLYINASYPQLLRCAFEDNSAFWGGGGLYNQLASPGLVDCLFTGNTSDHWGGAVHSRHVESAPQFTTCVFNGNSAPQGGASYARDAALPTFTGCTFHANASPDGAVLHVRSGAATTVIRSILGFSTQGAAATSDATGTVNLFCSDVYANAGGDYAGPLAGRLGADGNIAADPVYCDAWNGVFTLGGTSPCLPARTECGQLIGASGEGCVVSDVGDPHAGTPGRLALLPNFPNPFNPATVIRFALPAAGPVRVAVHDLAGRRIAVLADAEFPAGTHEVTWRAADARGRPLASGVYFVRMVAGGEQQVRKVALVR